MAAKFFGQFLLEKGLLSSDQLLTALDVQRRSNPVLGELAESMGLLSAADLQRISDQQRTEDKRFGDIALALGLLDAAQLEALLAEQNARRKLFGEILVEQGMLTREVVEAELALHQADREQAVQALELGIAEHPLGRAAAAAIDTTCKLFLRVLKMRCQLSSLIADGEPLPAFPVTARIAVSGDRTFSIALACDHDAMFGIARGFLGSAADDCDEELARDALGELLNIVMGYVVKEVLPVDAQYRASPPDFDTSAEAARASDPQALSILLTTSLGPMVLVLAG
jgi:CheY-specific phosphatase CheX